MRPGAQYGASGLHQLLFGSGYRELWISPVRVPVLDLEREAGGLTVIERGGGRQTRTLHLRGADGRRYVFRSVDKHVEQLLPEDLQGTVVENVVQDQISAFHPGGALPLSPLLERLGVLHVQPRMLVMPDHERLGEHRNTFAGMLGWLEERPSEGPDDTPGFAGSTEVSGTDDVEEELRAEGGRVAGREYLAARLVDFLVGDTDRGSDQWRWALVDGPDGVSLWRPIPRDRDWAFLRTNGLIPGLGRAFLPKQVAFGPRLPSLRSLTLSSIRQDRQFLAELPGSVFDSVGAELWRRLDESVLTVAVDALPPQHQQLAAAAMLAALRARREALPSLAQRFYRELAEEVDVAGTDEADVAEISDGSGGTVEVSLRRADGQSARSGTLELPRQRAPYFRRTFQAGETREVRVHLHGGADRAVVRGGAGSGIRVRVIGGAGDDLLADSSGSAGVWLHDAEGQNELLTGPSTRVDLRPFEPPADSATLINVATGAGRYRDWGRARSVAPVVDYVEGAGFVLGAGVRHTRYGFRRVPHAHRWHVELLFAPGTGGFGVAAGVDRPFFNSQLALAAELRATQFEPRRFSGYGNDTPPPADRDRGLVRHDHAEASVGLRYRRAAVRVAGGVRGLYTEARPSAESPLAGSEVSGRDAWSAAGVWAEGELSSVQDERQPRRGIVLSAAADLYPAVADLPGSFGGAEAELRGYITAGPTLALRLGGRKAWGSFPVQQAALLGGRRTLRGYPFQRFAGDASLYGGAELRASLGRVRLLTRGTLGALALADAGQVFVAGESPGGWHTAAGGGLTFTTLDLTVSAIYAWGEAGHLYLAFGFPF